MSTCQNTCLIELGTEELPHGFAAQAPAAWQSATEALLNAHQLTYSRLYTTSTPRRLTLYIEGLPNTTPAQTTLLKGPPAKTAVDANGNPTPAGLGFAKKQGLDWTQCRLEQQPQDAEPYVYAEKQHGNEPTSTVLQSLIPKSIAQLTGAHFMAWGDPAQNGTKTMRFSRPIRNLAGLWNNTTLPFEWAGLNASNTVLAHRLSAQATVCLPSASLEHYLAALRQQWVEADVPTRQKTIAEQLQQAATQAGGRLDLDAPHNQELLQTVTQLVEWPVVITGQFDPRYLSLPAVVVQTVMAAHQKYFAVFDANNTMLPVFLAVSNNPTAQSDPTTRHNIVSGNEQVLKARLEDAMFFAAEDAQKTLAERCDALKGITFCKGLGSMAEKAQRVAKLVQLLGQASGASALVLEHAQRAAELCKADLSTAMVRELTELQGDIGRVYAARDGEPEAVSQAIFEHYLPRFQGDSLPQTPEGTLVALADKLDTLIAVFSRNDVKPPTGSSDPMGLRRAANGILQILLAAQQPLSFQLGILLHQHLATLGNMAQKSETQVFEALEAFLITRLQSLVSSSCFPAIASSAMLMRHHAVFQGSLLNGLNVARQKLTDLETLLAQTPADTLKQHYMTPAVRVRSLLNKLDPSAWHALQIHAIRPDLFEHDSEAALWQLLEQPVLQPEALAQQLDIMLQAVLVNAPDAAIKQNRYALLARLDAFYLNKADFSLLILS